MGIILNSYGVELLSVPPKGTLEVATAEPH